MKNKQLKKNKRTILFGGNLVCMNPNCPTKLKNVTEMKGSFSEIGIYTGTPGVYLRIPK